MITLLSRMTRKGFHAAADGVNLPLWRSLFKPAGLLFGGDNTGAADGAGGPRSRPEEGFAARAGVQQS